MEMDFEDDDLRRLAQDPFFTMGFERGVVKAYRMRIQVISGAVDERDFYASAGWHFEKLKGDLLGKYSIRLNKKWRLIIKIMNNDRGKVVVLISICDYH